MDVDAQVGRRGMCGWEVKEVWKEWIVQRVADDLVFVNFMALPTPASELHRQPSQAGHVDKSGSEQSKFGGNSHPSAEKPRPGW